MIYKVNDTEFFNLSMIIDIHEDLKQINVLVKLFNKINNKMDMKSFLASEFAKALAEYNRLEKFFLTT